MINISSWTNLNNMRNDLTESYQLTRNLLTSDGDYAGIGDGWTPVSTDASKFTGSFNGQGYTIDGLTISLATTDFVGLFGHIGATGVVSNVGLLNVSIVGQRKVGALAGANSGSVSNVYSTGSVSSTASTTQVGGLIGRNFNSVINSHSSCAISGADFLGGLVGYNDTGSSISKCYSTGNITGTGGSNGGFIGRNNTTIINCYSTGNITSEANEIGGFVGLHATGSISDSYSVGTVNGVTNVGGFAGSATSTITNCYSTGVVTNSGSSKGGFVGTTTNIALIVNCGWFRNSSGATQAISGTELITYNIKDGGGEGYIDDTVDWFYDKTRDIYDIQSPVWDFSTPIWYERQNDFPKLSRSRVTGPLPLFFRIP